MTLDLVKVWQIMNKLSIKQDELSEKNIYVHLLSSGSSYCNPSFEKFLNYYSFRIDGDDIIVFNDDGIPYEDYTNRDFSYIPSVLLSFSSEKLDNWVETEIKLQLAKQERDKAEQKKDIKAQIERLQKQLQD